ncbi:UDP binding domain-containing protein [uncultured Prochlorococcus sp.]|uniref:UDP binding domain-containing protein n=1 Tax=uncultured Prochlorococcus sp. TaxID=159733 RepID=UPI002586DB02|nr:UDP binding domain-containing protein [uncultured Prochlorococcus sp.]
MAGKKIVICGFAFKANTNDTRESPAIKVCKDLINEGAFLSIHDPKVSEEQIKEDLGNSIFLNNSNLSSNPLWEKETSVKEAASGADAIIFLTEWEEYKYLNWQEIEEVMRPPSWIFDWRSTVNKKRILETNLKFWRIGEGVPE